MSNNSRQTQFSCRQNHGSSQNPGLSHHAQDLSRQQQQHQHRRTYDRHRDKLFTFLMVDLHQDIRVSSFIPGALTQRFLVACRDCSDKTYQYINPKEKINKCKCSFLS